jgi:hypothetical protein
MRRTAENEVMKFRFEVARAMGRGEITMESWLKDQRCGS